MVELKERLVVKKAIAIVEMPEELYRYLCDTSFERAFKLPQGHHELAEFQTRMRELELVFRNTQWELFKSKLG